MALTRRAALTSGAFVAAACTASAAAAEQALFSHGVASGDPLPTQVIIWTRVTPRLPGGDVTVTWKVATDSNLTQIVKRGSVKTQASRDHTVKVDVSGLKPGQVYYFGFAVGNEISTIGRTQTAPQSGGDQLKIALVSCSNFPAGWFNAYQAIARRGDVDLVLHVGDYIYEYGPGEYATEWGKTVGRVPDPPKECTTLSDYRLRYAQYRSDPDLQAAHACAPWLVTWDDHETSNDAYKDGAENHNPAKEGPWSLRKAAALQAYYEWLPLRDPAPGKSFEAINRSFDWGDLATIAMLETRVIARSFQLDYATDLDPALFDVTSGKPVKITDAARLATLDPKALPQGVMALPDLDAFKANKLNDPSREMLGANQQAWLAEVLKTSVAKGKRWQILGNQVIMGRVTSPDFKAGLPKEVRDAIAKVRPETLAFFELSQFNVPFNLDAWDGYPAARERLYDIAKQAGARLVVCTGDTHAAWANNLFDAKGELRGVEFGGTSVTSPSLADSFANFGITGSDLNTLINQANEEVVWHDETQRGYTMVTVTKDAVCGEFMAVDTVKSKTFLVTTAARYQTRFGPKPEELVIV
ncbi:alkaline phosphatase D family protein [Candidatus Phycosocius spiralis]|uniref:Alkaline phosphatase n=1 Tax=Candidatus Phycosocius spiralis TaxID=2815099 RepID=A0ABQ4PVN4_9PROT|nr:alkaline phosphatase D family protein [Candidatus Phycosocius spiralis]GIU66995.1 alkaline phosphatase [Candidatus Phycosocius spiralis]